MSQDPAAFVPFREVSRELLAVAHGLRIIPMPGDSVTLPDGRQSITMPGASTAGIPASIVNFRLILPPIVVNFFEFVKIEAQSIALPIIPAGETRWLTLSIVAESEYTNIITGGDPNTVTLGTPSFAWGDFAQGWETGIPAGDPRRYDWPILQLNDDYSIAGRMESTFIGFTPHHPFV